jgi:sugar phosphate isomerase/epimerase
MPRLKMVAIKDFRWEKTEKGWKDINCPLGEGMVDWKYFVRALAANAYHGPISLHIEYEVPGEAQAAHEENIIAALRHDLQFLKARIQEAYGV